MFVINRIQFCKRPRELRPREFLSISELGPEKYVHFFMDNIVCKVSSGQICPPFYGHVCTSSYIIGGLSKKGDHSLLFLPNIS